MYALKAKALQDDAIMEGVPLLSITVPRCGSAQLDATEACTDHPIYPSTPCQPGSRAATSRKADGDFHPECMGDDDGGIELQVPACLDGRGLSVGVPTVSNAFEADPASSLETVGATGFKQPHGAEYEGDDDTVVTAVGTAVRPVFKLPQGHSRGDGGTVEAAEAVLDPTMDPISQILGGREVGFVTLILNLPWEVGGALG